jgi:hypothetical protein
MKKLITGLILIILTLVTGCIDGRPPEFPVANPYTVSDGSGGVIVAYQVNNGSDAKTYVQRLGAQGETLWGRKGIDLGPGSGSPSLNNEGDITALFPDGQGNVTVVYSQQHAVWVLKLDANGNEVQPARKISGSDPPPMPVYFQAIGDNAGGVIAAWAASESSIGLQKIDANGKEVWSTEVKAPKLDRFDIASDDSGNTFIIWKDNPSYSEGSISVQKVDASGQAAWPDEGLQLTNTDNPGLVRSNFDHMIIVDGEGGIVAIWVQGILSEDGRNIIGHDLYAHHISSEGDVLWGENGVFIAQVAHEPRIIEETSGETVVLWGDLQRVYAQRLDVAGDTVWLEAGINIAQAGEHSNVIHYYAESDGKGGFVIVWNHAEGDRKFLRAQRVDADGNKLWGDDGIKVSSVSPYWGGYSTPARILPDGNGGFLVTWAAGKNIKDKTSSYIQRISGDGELLWGEKGIRLDS